MGEVKTIAIVVAVGLAIVWMILAEDRIRGLEIRMNLQEASQHWQEEPPK